MSRARACELARSFIERGDPTGWFEALYAESRGDARAISWADQVANPHLLAWLEARAVRGEGRRALVVGCGLGDDAEALSARGFAVTAFDISPTAIAWARRRFPNSAVRYVVADLFHAPEGWARAFDWVVEVYTLQVLPPELRPAAMRAMAAFVAEGGQLLVIARGREEQEPRGEMPWPLTRRELDEFVRVGLAEISFEEFMDQETPPVRRFRALYGRSIRIAAP